MKLLLLSVAATLGLTSSACSKDVTDDLGKFADRACACTDAECARTVVKDLVTFAKANSSGKGDEKKAGEHAKRLGQCAVKAGLPPSELMEGMRELQKL
ncbi:MAG: hypothetical protein R2939_16845 [Kofleriaceae bacterium]